MARRLLLLHGLAVAVVASPASPRKNADRVYERCPADVVPALARTGRLIVASQSGRATIIDLSSGSQRQLDGLREPHGATMSPDGRWGVVTDYGENRRNSEYPWRVFDGNRLQVIDMAAGTVARTITTGTYRGLHDVKILPGEPLRAIITAQGSRHVIVVNLAAGTVLAAMDPLGEGTHSIAVSHDGRRAFASNEGETTVSRLDLVNNRFDRHLQVGAEPLGIDVTIDGREVWVGTRAGTVVILNAESGERVATLNEAGFPDDISMTPDGRHALILDAQRNNIRIVRVADRQTVANLNLGRPSKATITPDSKAAFISMGRSDEVVGVDLDRRCEFARYRLPNTPDGIGWGAASAATRPTR